MKRIGEGLKSVAMCLGGSVIGLIVLTFSVIFLNGVIWISMKIGPLLVPAFLLTSVISLFVIGPLALMRKTPGHSVAGLMIASYAFGAILWVSSLLLTYELWGTFAVAIGILTIGIGIVPIAVLAVLFHAEWWHLLDLVILIALTYGVRLLAAWLATKIAPAGSTQIPQTSAQVESQPSGRHRSGQLVRNCVIFFSILGASAAIVTIQYRRGLHSDDSLSAVQVFSKASGSIVRIETNRHDGSTNIGTGFVAVLEGHPYILTNRHVVENADSLKVGVREDSMFEIYNYWLAENYDLGIVKVPTGLQTKALPLRTTPAQPGETVFAIGFPMGLGKSIPQGLVSANYGDALQFDAPISSGNSGGPVLDVHANVVGIATMGSRASTGEIIQNLNFAIPVAAIPSLVSFQPPHRAAVTTTSKIPAPFSSEGLSSPEQAPSVGPGAEVRRALPPNVSLSDTGDNYVTIRKFNSGIYAELQ